MKKHVIDAILKQEKITHPTPDALWCKRCQRGMSIEVEVTNPETGVITKTRKTPDDLKAGNDCPLCVSLSAEGNISPEAIGILTTCQTITDEWLEKIKLNNRQREMRMLRSIKDTGDVALEKVNKQDKIIEDLQKQIAALTKVDARAVEVPDGKMTVGKIDTKVGSK